MITLFWRGRSVCLIRLEKRSLSVGKNFGLAKTLPLGMLAEKFTGEMHTSEARKYYQHPNIGIPK